MAINPTRAALAAPVLAAMVAAGLAGGPAHAAPSDNAHAASPTATVQGRVWFDRNRNGVQDTGEPSVPNTEVLAIHDGAYDYVNTDRAGRYRVDVVAGSDVIVQVEGAGELAGRRSPLQFSPRGRGGDPAKDSDVEGIAPNVEWPNQRYYQGSASLPKVAAGRVVNVDAGAYRDPQPRGSVSGRMWNDLNRNGLQDAGESGIPDLVISLTDPELPTHETAAPHPGARGGGAADDRGWAITDKNGDYRIANIPLFKLRVYFDPFTEPAMHWALSPAGVGTDRSKDSDFTLHGLGFFYAYSEPVTIQRNRTIDLDGGMYLPY